jgi:hypothetical protein
MNNAPDREPPRMANYFYSLAMLITRRDIEQPFFTQMDAISARIAEPEYEEFDGPQITPMFPVEG